MPLDKHLKRGLFDFFVRLVFKAVFKSISPVQRRTELFEHSGNWITEPVHSPFSEQAVKNNSKHVFLPEKI